MARVAVILHNREVGPGRIEALADGHDLAMVDARTGRFPDEPDAAVVLGGFMSAFEEDEHPWLVPEKQWIRRLLASEVPLLGICLGSQLIADALGGRAYRAERPEVGVVEIELTDAGRGHSLARHMAPRSFMAHQDTFELPPGSRLLAFSSRHPAAFEIGSALAIQPHPEVSTEEALGWPAAPGFDMLERVGMSRSEYADGLNRYGDLLESNAVGLIGGWLQRLRPS